MRTLWEFIKDVAKWLMEKPALKSKYLTVILCDGCTKYMGYDGIPVLDQADARGFHLPADAEIYAVDHGWNVNAFKLCPECTKTKGEPKQ